MKYADSLTETVAYLKLPRTAKDVAEQFGLSRVSAYARLQALQTKGLVRSFDVQRLPGKTGPKAKLWEAV